MKVAKIFGRNETSTFEWEIKTAEDGSGAGILRKTFCPDKTLQFRILPLRQLPKCFGSDSRHYRSIKMIADVHFEGGGGYGGAVRLAVCDCESGTAFWITSDLPAFTVVEERRRLLKSGEEVATAVEYWPYMGTYFTDEDVEVKMPESFP